MDELLKLIYTELSAVVPETYREWNDAEVLKYPYVTYSLDADTTTTTERNQEGFYLDIDIFNRGAGLTVYEIEDQLTDRLHQQRLNAPGVYAYFEKSGSTRLETGDRELKRRNVRFYIKNYWRDKQYGSR